MPKKVTGPSKPERGGCDPDIIEKPLEMPDETPIPVPVEVPVEQPNYV